MTTKQRARAIYFLVVSIFILSCGGGLFSGGPASKLLTSEQILKIQLGQLLFQAGDLPARYESADPTITAPERFKDFPVAQNQLSVEFTYFSSWMGNATIFLYEQQADIDKAFQSYEDMVDDEAIPGIGEKSSFLAFSLPYGTEGGTINGANVSFVRCSAVVEIRLITDNADDVIAYARLLDNRLTPIVCRNSSVTSTDLISTSTPIPLSTASNSTQLFTPTTILAQIITTFIIDAQVSTWSDSGIFVQEFDEITIVASGTIDIGGVRSDPNGNPDVQPIGYGVVSTAPYGTLVGMIGSGDPFIVGNYYQGTAQRDGRLVFLINDVPNEYTDNSGQFQITITITKGK